MHRHDPMSLSSPDALPPPQPESYGWNGSSPDSLLLIRTVRLQDLPSLADLLASSFHSQEGIFGYLYPVLRVGIYEDLRSRLHNRTRHYACLAAVLRDPSNLLPNGVGDRPVGTVEISLRNHTFNPFGQSRYPYLSNLAVLADYRRQGIAQQLLHTSERIARDWGYQEIYLHVLENNHRARRLYWKVGYRLKAVNTNPVSWLLGRPRQLLLYKRLT